MSDTPRAFEEWWRGEFGDEDFKDCHNECLMAWNASRAALLADRLEVAGLVERAAIAASWLGDKNRAVVIAALESLAAQNASLKAHAEAMYARLVSDYTEGPCVDQHIGAALPAECYAYRHDYPGDGK